MKRIFILVILSLSASCVCQASEKKEYAFDLIDQRLLTHANAVMRMYQLEIKVESLESAVITEDYAVTILNKEGEQYAVCKEGFSKLTSIDDMHGYIYDRNGVQKTKIKESDFRVFPNSLAPGYYDDDKTKACVASYRDYPYTVEYHIKRRQNHTFMLPHWIAQPSVDCAVAHSALTITSPKIIPVKYYCVNGMTQPIVTPNGINNTYNWTIRDLAASRNEILSDEDFNGSPVVFLAAETFRLGGMTGEMKTWQTLGSFLYELNKNRDELTEKRRQEVLSLVAGIESRREKIAAIYKYMQEHTRYVSIQYGVGGWQTLDAKFLCENQYGDCKALSNYMMSLLKAAGITSYPVVVFAGRDETITMPREFPVNVFNHEILCVPLEQDTIWLECTSRDNPPGYLGTFTQDRDALMMTPSGGIVVHTPRYGAEANRIKRRIKGSCKDDGSLVFEMKNYYSGLVSENLLKYGYLSEQEKDQYINEKLHLPSYSVSDYRLSRKDEKDLLAFEESMNVTAGNMISRTGSYTLVNLDLTPAQLPFELMATERKKHFYLPYSYIVEDSFEVTLPAAATLESLPKPVTNSSPFGDYLLTIKQEGDKLVGTKRLVLKAGRYAPGQYGDYEAWVDDIRNQSHYKVILRTK